jgi:hypothetical protein
MRHIAIAALLGAALAANAQERKPDLTVFGQMLGARLSVAECPRMPAPNDAVYADATPSGCWEYKPEGTLAGPAPTDGDVSLCFRRDSRPELLGEDCATLRIRGGLVVEMRAETGGAANEARAFAALRAKYGRPTATERHPMENAFGAKYDSTRARWNLGSLTVAFNGVEGTLDSGIAVVSVQKAEPAAPKAKL